MLKYVLKYSLISCGVLVVINLASLLMGRPTPDTYAISEVIGYAIIIVSLSVMFFGIRRYRDRELDGKITFWKAFGFGMAITTFAAVTFGLYNWVYIKVIYPDFITDYVKYSKEQIMNSGLSQAEIEKNLHYLQDMSGLYSNVWFQNFIMFATVLAIGIVMSILASLILKRK